MKIALVVHGFPPENYGGTENSVLRSGFELLRAGHEVLVIAGSMRWEEGFRESSSEILDPESGRALRVLRIHRADLYFDHWQKSACPDAGAAFQSILRRERPDVVHVHHWIRLSRDLVQRAAHEGLPSVVTLHDYWTSCALVHRLPPPALEFCARPNAADPCTSCAGRIPPFTPWLDDAATAAEHARRSADLARELELAHRVIALSRAQLDALRRFGPRACERAEVLHLGADMPAEIPPALPSPAALGALRLGSWGTLSRSKGQDLLLDARELLAGDPRRIELHFAGIEADPAFARELRERARGAPVELHGPFPRGGLADSPVVRVHAMVHTSRHPETWGVVVDEAAALGLPMVLPDAGALREHVGDPARGALFYAPGDARDLAHVLRRFLDEPELLPELRRGALALRAGLPSWSWHAQRLLEIYAAAIAAGPPPCASLSAAEEAAQRAWSSAWDASLAKESASALGLASP